MREIKVAYRYAKSLLGIALEQNVLEDVHNDMQLISHVCSENRDLEILLRSPIVKSDKKAAILSEIFGKHISKISNTFISIVLVKKRESILADITTAFIDLYKTEKNIATATVTTAVKISEQQKTKIIDLLKSQGSASVDLKEIINPEIIGGMILKVGDKQIDESIKRKLMNLEMEFDDNSFIKGF